VRKALFPAIIAVLVVALVATGIQSSPGSAMRAAAAGYAERLSSGDADSAWTYLTDSLSSLAGVRLLSAFPAPAWGGSILTGREDSRGFPISALGEGGESRTLWLRLEGGAWSVSGDTWLDGVLGSAAMVCREFAMSVLPQVTAGAPAEGFSCPVSGTAYFIDEETGSLLCSAGHLGEGLSIGSGACDEQRARAAAEVRSYMEEGHEFPSTIEGMWQASSGAFGQRGGYRCPDNGYSYYVLQDSLVWCPFHQAGSPVFATGLEP
jgi:hypothetical protein